MTTLIWRTLPLSIDAMNVDRGTRQACGGQNREGEAKNHPTEAIEKFNFFELGWHGVVDWSMDQSPSVGYTGKYKNIFYGLGYSGHGVNLTSIFGRIIADLEAGHDEP